MDQWLIRTSQNWIAGPYRKEQICQMIQDGKLTVQDEVCPAGGYWISLHENDEVAQFLGVKVPKKKGASDEEITETQIVLEEEKTDPDLAYKEQLNDAHAPEDTTAVILTDKMKNAIKSAPEGELKANGNEGKKQDPLVDQKPSGSPNAESTPANGTSSSASTSAVRPDKSDIPGSGPMEHQTKTAPSHPQGLHATDRTPSPFPTDQKPLGLASGATPSVAPSIAGKATAPSSHGNPQVHVAGGKESPLLGKGFILFLIGTALVVAYAVFELFER